MHAQSARTGSGIYISARGRIEQMNIKKISLLEEIANKAERIAQERKAHPERFADTAENEPQTRRRVIRADSTGKRRTAPQPAKTATSGRKKRSAAELLKECQNLRKC